MFFSNSAVQLQQRLARFAGRLSSFFVLVCASVICTFALAEPTAGSLPFGYTKCATEGGTCSFPGMTKKVIYGERATWTNPRSFTGGTLCSNAVFGDPLPYVVKSCYYQQFSTPSEAGYTQCAAEGGTCSFSGTAEVVYGTGTTWTNPRSFTGGTKCSNAVFGDPRPYAVKACYYKPTAIAQFLLNLNISGAGNVGLSDGSACNSNCSKSYNSGASVTLTATPAVGYSFSGWSGACTGTSQTCTLTMNAAKSVSASFTVATTSSSAPVLNFTDLVSGPRLGNSDNSQPGQVANSDGAIVTLWGKNLGNGTNSSIKVGGVPARVYYWGPASRGGGADLSGRLNMQMIEFQIPRTAPLGAVNIEVTVNGVVSNTLPFTTRDTGKIYFIGAGANASDSNPGSYSSPWKSFYQSVSAIVQPGDIVYLMDGFVASTNDKGDAGLVYLGADGTATAPKAIVAYPGAIATIGGITCNPSGRALIGGFNFDTGNMFQDWVVSKLRFVTPASCDQDTAIILGPRFRAIGNYISTPKTSVNCMDGALQCGGGTSCGDNIAVLGNQLTKIQSANPPAISSKQCHGIYISGNRANAQLESNREIAWNYIHDNSNNRAINIYNESFNGQYAPRAYITGHKIHDNWIENQSGVGILVGKDVVGENWLYNNVLVNVGLGPDHTVPGSVFSDFGLFFPFEIRIGSEYTTTDSKLKTAYDNTVLHVYNNLVYGRSNPETGVEWAFGLMGYWPTGAKLPIMNFYNNMMISTVPGVPYLVNGSNLPKGKNNLWFGAGAAPAGETAPITPTDITNLFVNAAGGNFRLKIGGTTANPARNAGVAVPIARDFDGAPRQQGVAVDVGPYEAQ